MEEYKKLFISLCIEKEIIKFGDFTLKSRIKSPYFFNSGCFSNSRVIREVGQCLAEAIIKSNIPHDMIFSPAYKGIPLLVATCCQLYNSFTIDVPFSFNRKEEKKHGEGGNIVGSPLKGKILLIDDVMTAGTAIGQSVEIINNHQAELTGIMVLLDRQEVIMGDKTTIEMIKEKYNVPVHSLITLKDIINYLENEKSSHENIQTLIKHYQLNQEKIGKIERC